MSNKSDVLSFDDAINNHKKALAESLVNFDEGHRVRKILLDVDSNSADYEYYFQSGQQSKQGEVDTLQTEVDELKKRIESAMELLEYNEYADSALQALEILKGDKI